MSPGSELRHGSHGMCQRVLTHAVEPFCSPLCPFQRRLAVRLANQRPKPVVNCVPTDPEVSQGPSDGKQLAMVAILQVVNHRLVGLLVRGHWA